MGCKIQYDESDDYLQGFGTNLVFERFFFECWCHTSRGLRKSAYNFNTALLTLVHVICQNVIGCISTVSQQCILLRDKHRAAPKSALLLQLPDILKVYYPDPKVSQSFFSGIALTSNFTHSNDLSRLPAPILSGRPSRLSLPHGLFFESYRAWGPDSAPVSSNPSSCPNWARHQAS